MKKDYEDVLKDRPKLIDDAVVWDQRERKWSRGWTREFKRTEIWKAIDNITFDASTTTKTSESFLCEPFTKFAVIIDIDVTSNPTDILFEIFFSDDNVNFYKLMNGPFGDLRYEDSAGDLKELIHGECHGTWCRVKATATGTSGTQTFRVTAKMIFSN